ncbi:MAG: hypothetical protein HY023_00440 [Chloroflexi bacterium]|nr:hypothetical protein [Chloroflexota bacterium]
MTYAFALIWLFVGIAPSLLIGPEAATTRSIGALPAIYVFPALAFEAVSSRLARRFQFSVTLGPWLIFVGLVAATGVTTFRDYFLRWGESPDVRAAYQHTLIEEMKYIDSRFDGGIAVLSSINPSAPHDPYIAELALRRKNVRLRWADGREAMIFPDDTNVRWIIPASTPLDPFFDSLLARNAERVDLRPGDLDPYFAVTPRTTNNQARILARAASANQRIIEPTSLPVNFADAVEFVGYEWQYPSVRPGDTLRLMAIWRVTDPERVGPRVPPAFKTDAVLFVHLLDGQGGVIAQQDRLDAPSWDWVKGDVIAQIFRLALPADLPPGEYSAETGIYNRSDGARLPVLDSSGATVSDRAVLAPLRVATP